MIIYNAIGADCLKDEEESSENNIDETRNILNRQK